MGRVTIFFIYGWGRVTIFFVSAQGEGQNFLGALFKILVALPPPPPPQLNNDMSPIIRNFAQSQHNLIGRVIFNGLETTSQFAKKLLKTGHKQLKLHN